MNSLSLVQYDLLSTHAFHLHLGSRDIGQEVY
jgi:hypothetical protein